MVVSRTTRIAAIGACVAVVLASCSAPSESTGGPSAATTTATGVTNAALKTIDPKVFRNIVQAAAQQLMVPGAMVLLRTPQGTFDARVGTTDLGAQTPPTADP